MATGAPRQDDAANPEVYDFIGIGLGPFNLSLACLAEPIEGLRGLFLERNAGFDWHPGMLIDNTTLQNPCLADLVSLADPTSLYSYLNYCKHSGEIYSHYINGSLFISREDYNRYCRWVAAQLRDVRFRHDVTGITHDARAQVYRVRARDSQRQEKVYAARKLVIGVGAEPSLPPCCEGSRSHYIHASEYLTHKAQLQQKKSITIVGSGQSAAEICHDLLRDAEHHGYTLNWITRSPYFFQMETTKLTLEMFSPDYTDYFYGLPEAHKRQQLAQQSSLYKGINAKLMDEIYQLLERARRHRRFDFNLLTRSELQACCYDADRQRHTLEFRQDDGTLFRHHTDGLVFATGYTQRVPRFVGGIEHRLRFDEQGRYRLWRNYAADINGCEVFVQNAGLHSHGLSNPELGLACYRNSCILRELTGVEHYRIEGSFALQSFSVPKSPQFCVIGQETKGHACA